ncbi:MAG: hypothetical protein KUG82_20510 [Pseudomonadales bacterium]|nr:hypothetical protein [Pseudomonadales bacterium]
MNKLNAHRLSELILLSLFMLVILAPLSKTLLSQQATMSAGEKRNLSPMPIFSLEAKSLAQFPEQFEKYYNDHFGFRESFIKLYLFIMVNGFQTSPVDKVIVGDNDYLFYNDKAAKIFEDIQGINPFTQDELKIWKGILERKKEWLDKEGIKYLLVFSPNKHTIYPEYIPKKYIPRSGKTRLDQFIEYMKTNSDVAILDLREPLLQAKLEKQAYYKSDTHWNDWGAYVASQTIIETVSEMFPEKSPNMDLPVSGNKTLYYDGDLSLMLGLSDIYKEDAELLTVTDQCAHTNKLTLNTVAVKNPFSTTCKQAELKVVVFRDSFFTAVAPFFAERFKKVDYIWNNFNHIILKELIHQSKPDIVIEERAERLLAVPPLYHEEKIRSDSRTNYQQEKAQFTAAETTQLLISPKDEFSSLHGENDLIFKVSKQGLKQTSVGNDPFFLLPTFSIQQNAPLFIKIRISSPMYNNLQVYYTTKDTPYFNESQTAHRTLHKGLNEIVIALEDINDTNQTNLRFDLGSATGEFTLHSIEVRQ